MRLFFILVVGLFIATYLTPPASADAVISGRACVIDGNTLQVGGKVKNKKCWGGITVRLHGSEAPKLNETCKGSDGKTWECGQLSKIFLAKMIVQHSISCYHLDGEFENGFPIVTCISGRQDLALEMVMQGMAKAPHDRSKRYQLEENAAMKAKRGIWK